MKLFFLILLTLASVNMSARENGEVVISAKTGISNSHQKTNIPKAKFVSGRTPLNSDVIPIPSNPAKTA